MTARTARGAGVEDGRLYRLVYEAARAVAGSFTRRGHVAIRNEREGGGYCSHKRCSPICIRQRALRDELAAWLVEHEGEIEAGSQLALDVAP